MKIYDRFSSFQIPTARSYIFSRAQPGSRVSVVGGNQYFRSMAVVGVEGPVWQGLKGTSRTNKWKILVGGSSKRVQDEPNLKAMGHDVLSAIWRRNIKLNKKFKFQLPFRHSNPPSLPYFAAVEHFTLFAHFANGVPTDIWERMCLSPRYHRLCGVVVVKIDWIASLGVELG